MKKIKISILLCLIVVCTYGQDFCMYVSEEKICIEISKTKFILKSEVLDTIDIKNAVQITDIGNLKYIKDLDEGLFFIEMQNTNENNLIELRKILNAKENVIYTSPVYKDERGIEGSTYTNEIIVRIKSKEDYSILQESADYYSIVELKKLSNIDELTYSLVLPHNPEKDAAEVSIELHESGLFDFAHPNIITLWPFEDYPPSDNIKITPDRKNVVFPNPVSNILYIELEKIEHIQNKNSISFDIRLYNSLGKIYHQTKATSGIVEFSVSNIPNGIYFLTINDENGRKYKIDKIIVKH